MGFYRVFKWMFMLMFLVEVINPSTKFVREQPNPFPFQKTAKFEKKVLQEQQEQGDAESPESPDGEDFLACSAIIPATTFSPQPHGSGHSVALRTEDPPQGIHRSIHRPPSRS